MKRKEDMYLFGGDFKDVDSCQFYKKQRISAFNIDEIMVQTGC